MSATGSQSPTFTLTEIGKANILHNQLTNLLATIYLEGVKHDFLAKQRLTSKQIAELWEMQGRKIAAMQAEADFMAERLKELRETL